MLLRSSLLTLTILLVGVSSQSMALAQTAGPYQPLPKPQAPQASKPALVDSSTKSKIKNFFKNTGRTVTPTEPKSIDRNATQTPPPEASPFAASPAPQSPMVAAPPAPPAPPKRPPMLTTPTLTDIGVPELTLDNNAPPRLASERIDDPKNPMGLMHAKLALQSAQTLLTQKQAAQAIAKLAPLNEWLITATEAHIDLYKALNKTPSARVQAEFEKRLALEFAELRDKTLLTLGQAYLANQQPQQAIKPLVAVVQSQARSATGLKAYEALQVLGFTEALQLTP